MCLLDRYFTRGFRSIALGVRWGFRVGGGRRTFIELKGLEEVIELIVSVVAHVPFLVGCRSPAGVGVHYRGIVPRMVVFLLIRVAEPWTVGAVMFLVACAIALVFAILWLVHRS